MPLPSIADTASRHLFTDVDKMRQLAIPQQTINHIVRLRDLYNRMLAHPTSTDRSMVEHLCTAYGIGSTKAREDLRIVKSLLGNMQRASKDYHRFRFISMIEETYEKARDAENLTAMADAAGKYARYTQLDKPDEADLQLDTLRPQSLEFTDDVTTLGIARVAGIKEKKKRLLDKYMSDDVVDVKAEEIEYNPEDIFENLPPSYGTTSDL